jgi:hypothetical protein
VDVCDICDRLKRPAQQQTRRDDTVLVAPPGE